MKTSRLGLLVLLGALGAAPGSDAQTLPSGPVRALDGDLIVSGEAVATIGQRDETAYFNYTDYQHNALRLFRVSLSGAWRPARRLAFVGEVRSEDLERPEAYAAYVRLRPWADREFDIQAGRIPQTFGAFSRRAYATDNPVIGAPLAYQYLTSLRPDAVPAAAEDLLRMRGRGWLSSFPVGNATPAPGIPLVTALRWDSGVQVRWKTGIIEASGAVTTGTLSDPRVADNNDSPQFAGRVAARPVVGLVIGTSAARGAWIANSVTRQLTGAGDRGSYTQTAWGADAEYSRGHWLLRGETIWSRWLVPFAVSSPEGVNLTAVAAWVEGRYKVTPRLIAGGRIDHLGFSDLDQPGGRTPWDAPVTRIEASLGWYLQRNLIARVGVQRNDRDAGRVRERTYYSTQLVYWF